jgi:hypothetical protein
MRARRILSIRWLNPAARLAGAIAFASLLPGLPSLAQDPVTTPDLQGGVVEGQSAELEADDGLPAVLLASFTTEISEREPVDDISFLGNDKNVIFFFTDLRNLEGQEIRHVWSFNGQPMGTVRFQVEGDRWRVWSSKQLLPDWLGEWNVSVLNADDEVMATESFTYQDAL